ncbi:nuclear transport factor 2 family protein [Aminobacter sp. MSH1]|jgi:hypothetical protein|uniref:nuclear transport factor 2 family protein n=1 Tax=Aminobacter sp. MSH1 TaxID=374606 RepID=UPI000D372F77|nr:nuclear transport factor 2 family protein [Aminobacter sp. MSH1]
MRRIIAATLPVAFMLVSGAAFAGPALDMAKARIDAIAKGDVAAVTAEYTPDAALSWVGGPLDGSYSTGEMISEVWTKFSNAQGPQTATVGDVWEAANPKGATVVANVVFAGKSKVPVLYVMTYRDGKLVDEIWQVNPPAQ